MPNLPVCSAEDLISIDPADIVTKLVFLFELVMGLFGALLVGGALAFAADRWDRARIVKRLEDPAMGFRLASEEGVGVAPPHPPPGAFATDDAARSHFSPPTLRPPVKLWRFTLEPPGQDLGAPVGTALQLCTAFGLPFARLRTALPDEWFGSDARAAFGRKHGLSALKARFRFPAVFFFLRP